MDAIYISKILGMEIELDRIYTVEDVSFDVTGNINWKAGAFGDSGSCFLPGKTRSSAAHIMMTNGMLAYRYYKNGKGVGRGWLYKIPKEDDCVVIFNIQGSGGPTKVLKDFKKLFGLDYEKIAVRTTTQASNFIYADGRAGYVLSREKKDIDSITLELIINFGECYLCGKEQKLTPIYLDSKIFCGTCFTNNYFYCYNCSTATPHSEAVHLKGNQQIVCKNCEVKECRSCGSEICKNMVWYGIYDKYHNKKIPNRLWFCGKQTCRTMAAKELLNPIKKKEKPNV